MGMMASFWMVVCSELICMILQRILLPFIFLLLHSLLCFYYELGLDPLAVDLHGRNAERLCEVQPMTPLAPRYRTVVNAFLCGARTACTLATTAEQLNHSSRRNIQGLECRLGRVRGGAVEHQECKTGLSQPQG